MRPYRRVISVIDSCRASETIDRARRRVILPSKARCSSRWRPPVVAREPAPPPDERRLRTQDREVFDVDPAGVVHPGRPRAAERAVNHRAQIGDHDLQSLVRSAMTSTTRICLSLSRTGRQGAPSLRCGYNRAWRGSCLISRISPGRSGPHPPLSRTLSSVRVPLVYLGHPLTDHGETIRSVTTPLAERVQPRPASGEAGIRRDRRDSGAAPQRSRGRNISARPAVLKEDGDIPPHPDRCAVRAPRVVQTAVRRA
jgi:hypothetical protein